MTSKRHVYQVARIVLHDVTLCKLVIEECYEIVERNWTCAAGEADIIARDEETVVFVEVKTRSSCERGLPSEAVDAEKRERYERIAALFLQGYDVVDVPVRFDIISLVVIGPDRAMIRHHINAFSAE